MHVMLTYPYGGQMARQPNDYPPIMDTAMVGELLQMSPVHVRRLAREGVIPAYRIEGVRAFKFKRDEVLNWFESQKVDLVALDEEQLIRLGD